MTMGHYAHDMRALLEQAVDTRSRRISMLGRSAVDPRDLRCAEDELAEATVALATYLLHTGETGWLSTIPARSRWGVAATRCVESDPWRDEASTELF